MRSEGLGFSVAAREVATQARRLGLRVPGFRTPPRVAGAVRTIRAGADGPVVAVVIRGRPLTDVVADLIEGVVVANALGGPDAIRTRRRIAAGLERGPVVSGRPARVA